jgi:fatty acid desaturase
MGLYYFPVATFFVFYFPWMVCSFGLMQGNFKEHIFVDPDDHENNYKSAFTCINAPSNALTFNTGYHIEHHEQPGLPWYKLPTLFLKNIDKHAQNDSFVFSGIGSMEVGGLVLREKWDELADAYLNIGQPKRSKEELILEFKRRLTPVNYSRTMSRNLALKQQRSASTVKQE